MQYAKFEHNGNLLYLLNSILLRSYPVHMQGVKLSVMSFCLSVITKKNSQNTSDLENFEGKMLSQILDIYR